MIQAKPRSFFLLSEIFIHQIIVNFIVYGYLNYNLKKNSHKDSEKSEI